MVRGSLWPFRSEREIAAFYEVSDKTVNRVRRGERWTHVQDPPPLAPDWAPMWLYDLERVKAQELSSVLDEGRGQARSGQEGPSGGSAGQEEAQNGESEGRRGGSGPEAQRRWGGRRA